MLTEGNAVTVSRAKGYVGFMCEGKLPFKKTEINLANMPGGKRKDTNRFCKFFQNRRAQPSLLSGIKIKTAKGYLP